MLLALYVLARDIGSLLHIPRSEIFEPNYLDGNLVLIRLDIVEDQRTAHAPSVIPSIVIHGLRCAAGWVVAKEPHVRSIGI